MGLSRRICTYCGREFQPASGRQIYCNGLHTAKCINCNTEFQISIRDIREQKFFCSHRCLVQHNQLIRKRSRSQHSENLRISTNLNRYGVSNPMESSDIVTKSVQNRYHVSRSLFPEKTKRDSIRKWNEQYKSSDIMNTANVQYLNDGDQHIAVYPWEDVNKVKAQLQDKRSIDVSECNMLMLYKSVANAFLNQYDVQGADARGILHIGLVYHDELVQVTVVGRAADPNHVYQIYRICTHPRYYIINGVSTMVQYIIRDFEALDPILYSHSVRFSNIESLNLDIRQVSSIPSLDIWYFNNLAIPDDQIFNRDLVKLFGECSRDKDELMLSHKWRKITISDIYMYTVKKVV